MTQSYGVYWRETLWVNPDDLYKQFAHGQPKKIRQHPFFGWIKSVLSGENPEDVGYRHLNPNRFKTIAFSLRDEGWEDGEEAVIVAIDSKGKVIVVDGLHRATAALALGIEKIPAWVVYRDESWMKLKCLLLAVDWSTTVYQQINHCDFSGWTVVRDDIDRRAGEILSLVGDECKTALDFGCNIGMLTSRLAEAGIEIDGCDISATHIDIAKMLKNMDVTGDNRSAEFYQDIPSGKKYDMIAALSVMHHYIDSDPPKAAGMVKDLFGRSNKYVFYDCPKKGDLVGGTSKYTDPNMMVSLIRQSVGGGRSDIVSINGRRPLIRWTRTDKSVIGIVGAAFSGSTTLSMVMDCLPDVFATGEDIAIITREDYCRKCGPSCKVWTKDFITSLQNNQNMWWDKIFTMAGVKHLVSSDKGAPNYDRIGHPDKIMLLWKDPRAWVVSWLRNHLLKDINQPKVAFSVEDEHVTIAMNVFLANYSANMDWIDKYSFDCVSLPIEDLALDLESVLLEICEWAGIAATGAEISGAASYRDFDHHQISGNTMAALGGWTDDYIATFGEGLAVDDRWKKVLTEKQEKMINENEYINNTIERIKKWQILQQ